MSTTLAPRAPETVWVAGRFDAKAQSKKILFGRMYEDAPGIELKAFKPKGRVLCIASAGCTAMAPDHMAPLLAWRLPLEVFAPEAWFARAARNLAPGGLLVVVSHGDDEAGIAKRLCAAQDLTAVGGFRDDGPLLPRPRPAVVTLWRR